MFVSISFNTYNAQVTSYILKIFRDVDELKLNFNTIIIAKLSYAVVLCWPAKSLFEFYLLTTKVYKKSTVKFANYALETKLDHSL